MYAAEAPSSRTSRSPANKAPYRATRPSENDDLPEPDFPAHLNPGHCFDVGDLSAAA